MYLFFSSKQHLGFHSLESSGLFRFSLFQYLLVFFLRHLFHGDAGETIEDGNKRITPVEEANGAYPPEPHCGHLRKLVIVAPQVFHGMKLDVMVPESSKHLDRFFGWSRLSSQASLYILPGKMMARYWSEQSALTKMQEKTVMVTSPPLVPLASFSKASAMVLMIPVQSTMPPELECENPSTKYTIRAMIKDGPVVKTMCLM